MVVLKVKDWLLLKHVQFIPLEKTWISGIDYIVKVKRIKDDKLFTLGQPLAKTIYKSTNQLEELKLISVYISSFDDDLKHVNITGVLDGHEKEINVYERIEINNVEMYITIMIMAVRAQITLKNMFSGPVRS